MKYVNVQPAYDVYIEAGNFDFPDWLRLDMQPVLVGKVDRGTWDATTEYLKNDAVQHGGEFYYALEGGNALTGIEPGTMAAEGKWLVIVPECRIKILWAPVGKSYMYRLECREFQKEMRLGDYIMKDQFGGYKFCEGKYFDLCYTPQSQ